MWITSSLSTANSPTDIALGNFDGVHLGHQTVIQPILSAQPAAKLRQPVVDMNEIALLRGYSDRCSRLLASSGTASSNPSPYSRQGLGADALPTVVTFYPHPREFFSGRARPWLTPLSEKAIFMRRLGVEQLVLLPFSRELANLSPPDFVEAILINRLQARHISVGADFRFGRQRAGDVALLAKLATQRGVQVTIVELAQDSGDRISSSRIRQALGVGDMSQAQQLLGRPYCLAGRVVQGQQLGRQLGFPTANLQVLPEKFLPRTGVYSVMVYGVPNQLPQQGVPGVMNLGVRPTVDGQQQTVEVHLLNWQGNLYGCTLTVALVGFLRPEQRFDSLDQLKTQIQADCAAARTALQVGNFTERKA